MRTLAAATVLLLSVSATAQTVKTILQNGPVDNRYDIVILGDGYQAFEESRFDQDALNAMTRIFSKPGWGTYQSYYNVHTVFRASAESGADHPEAIPPVYKNTAYDATYDYGGTPRCVYIQNQALATADSLLAPDVEGRVIVLVNDPQYGGCGGTFAVAYNGSSGPETQTHEFGHAFAQLADEYDYGSTGAYTGPEPAEANITAESTGSLKWPLWIGSQGVGAFLGAGTYPAGMWRPKSDCLMRNLGIPLCPVCNEQIVVSVYGVVTAIENASPTGSSVTLQRPAVQTFSFTNLVPGPNKIEWSVDGVIVATGGTSFGWSSSGVRSGRHTVKATVTDLTSLVRKDPLRRLVSSRSWSVDVVSAQPGSYTTFGAGCQGSTPAPLECITANAASTVPGFPTLPGTTYALTTIAPGALRVSGFELFTSSNQGGSVAVPVALYTADPAGRPAARVASGTMQAGPTQAWYEGTFTAPYDAQPGQTLFLAFTVPSTFIHASIASGFPTPYFLDNGPNGSWNGPLLGYAWAYKVKCAKGTGEVPVLSSSGLPEIDTSFEIRLGHARPSAPAALLFGGSNTSWSGVPLPIGLGPLGAPGCSVLASGEIIAPVAVDPTGAASLTIGLPADPGLVGATFHNQFYVVDPAANGLGLAWSNGGTGTVGK